MAKNSYSDWDTTAGNNTDIGGINIDENCAAANINNALRAIMGQLKTLDIASMSDTTGRIQAVQTFTASGTYTPTSGTKYAMVEIQAPGGGGGNGNSTTSEAGAGGGGNAGNYVKVLLDVSAIGTSTLTIGAVGSGATSSAANGGTGGNVTWADGATSITVVGGTGGRGMTSQSASNGNNTPAANTANTITAGANHVATLADVIGAIADPSFTIGADVAYSTSGQSSRFGQCGRAVPRNISGINNGENGSGYGAGGGGGASRGAQVGGSDGGDGSGGYVVITEYTS